MLELRPILGLYSCTSLSSAKIRAIREIRGNHRGMKHEKLTGEVLGAAVAVLNELRPGPDEKLYENALLTTDDTDFTDRAGRSGAPGAEPGVTAQHRPTLSARRHC